MQFGLRFWRRLAVAGVWVSVGLSAPAVESAPLAPAISSLEIARSHLDAYRYEQAKSMGEQLLLEAEHSHGNRSLQAADAIGLLLQAWVKSSAPRDYEAMMALARRAVDIREKSDHFEVAHAVSAVAEVLRDQASYPSAAAEDRRALALLVEQRGDYHLEVATAMFGLGVDLGSVDRAESIETLERALRMRESLSGPESPLVAEVLEALARVRPNSDERGLADARRAVAIRETAHGSTHPALGEALGTLGLMLIYRDEYEESRSVLEHSLSILEATVGPRDRRVGSVLDDLASAYRYTGDLAHARLHYERALVIYQDVYGDDHLSVAPILSNVTYIYWRMGNFARATETMERILAIRRARLAEDDLRIARTLSNLSRVYGTQHKFDSAKSALDEALTIVGRHEGEGSLLVEVLDNLGRLETILGDYDAARLHLERGLAIANEIYGQRHRQVAWIQISLARPLRESGDPERAIELVEAALQTLKDIGHPWEYDFIELARAYRVNGQPMEAMSAALTAEGAARRSFVNATRRITHTEALRFATRRRTGLDLLLTILEEEYGRMAEEYASRVFDQIIRSRALVLDEMASRHARFLKEQSPEIERLVGELQAARKALAQMAVLRYSATAPADLADKLTRAQHTADDAERTLAGASQSFRERLNRLSIGLDDVRRSLPAESALVAYAIFEREPRPTHQQETGSRRGAKSVGDSGFMAFVLRSGDAHPVVVPLGDAKSIERLVGEWRAEVAASPPAWPDQAAVAEARAREAGIRLRRAIWDPVVALVGKRELVFVVPDGPLQYVNLLALPSDDPKGYLVEEDTTIHYLSAEKDLIQTDVARDGVGSILAIGGPDFDKVDKSVAGRTDPMVEEWPASESIRSSCEALAGREFSVLRGARAEAEEVASLWTASDAETAKRKLVLTGPLATEAAFKAGAPGRRFIHIATHGFFAGESCDSIISTSAALDRIVDEVENPLLHAGLALAGANHRDRVLPGSSGEDGMLTAQEIASLDLSQAECVVLSGCDTGLGRTVAGEGVLGLRRAFTVAGADTLVMSLWEVGDLSTRGWMRDFYSSRRGGGSTADAVREATLKQLKSRRRDGLDTHPYSWGAFVASGNWH